jgi:ligand-binding sensor domain-containing protein/two-component sensor histidine kinase
MRVSIPSALFKLIPVLLSLTFSAGSAQPDVMRFDHISIEQGLSDLTVFCFAQDSAGFLWFGTSDGLNKYDGHTFTVFRSDPGDSTSMAPGPINSLCLDRFGTLWIATGAGLSVMPPDSSRPRRVPNTAVYGTLQSKAVNWVETLSNGDIGIATSAGFFRHEAATGKFVEVKVDTGAQVGISTFIESRDGTLWFGAAHRALIALNPVTNERRYYMRYRADPKTQLDNWINRIKEDRNGRVWVAANDGLYRLDTLTKTFVRTTEKQGLRIDLILDILEDRSGTLWVGTFHLGVARYRPETDDFVRFTNDQEDPQSLNSNRLTRMFEDRGGILWFATYRAGLNRHNAKRSSFRHFVPRKTSGKGLSTDGVYAILEDHFGELWFGTYGGGLNRYSPRTDSFTYYNRSAVPPHRITSDNILSIVEMRSGDLLLGGSEGLNRFERSTGRTIHYPMVDERKRLGSEREVKCILEDSSGIVWFGTFIGGLHRFNPKTQEMGHYKYLGGDSLSPGSPGVWTLCEDTRGRLWIGTYGAGMFMMDRTKGTFKRFVYDESKPLTSLSNNGVYCILRDDIGVLWIGTMGGGLNRFDPETEMFTHYTVKDGLPNNFVKGIRKDRHGYLWLSTDFGLSRFDPQTGTFKTIAADDGLMGNVFLSGAHAVGKHGHLYFGGEKGAVAFHPDSIKENTFVPPVVITTMRVVDVPWNPATSASLSYDENSLSFEFVALDYTLPEKNRYAYKLEGVDHDWIQAGTRRYASYPHLRPGMYTFRVKGSNNDGIWNEQGASVSFTIEPPFWETWWFLLGAVSVVLSGTVWFYNYRVNRLLEIERLRVKIASDLHDDIGSSLTRISLQSELIQEGIEPQEMNKYLKNIASMSRELVTTMSDIVWSIDARNDTVENLLTKIRDFASNTFSAKQIEFTFAYSGMDMKKKLPVEKRENLYLVCKEAINNIAKHSGANNVKIVIRNDHDKLTVVIEDDGKGIGPAVKLNSHGLKNMRMRAQRLGGTMEILHDNGTRVVLTMKPM